MGDKPAISKGPDHFGSIHFHIRWLEYFKLYMVFIPKILINIFKISKDILVIVELAEQSDVQD